VIPRDLDLAAFSDLPFPVATRAELKKAGMLSVPAMGRKLAVFWNDGDPRVFDDSCAHLGLPLTLGKLSDGGIRCRYHGWRYALDKGDVVEQPTLRKPQPCRLKRFGALLAGDLVFAWLGDPDDVEGARSKLPEEVLDGISLYRITFDCPFYMALFSSVDYAHFQYHTLYGPFYGLYRMFRDNEHQPGTSFPSKVVAEDERRVTVRIEEANRDIHMYATAAEMDDGGVNFFQTFVTPLSPMKTLYWECYKPRSRNALVNLAARASFRMITTRLLESEDRIWTGSSAPNFVNGENIHLSENDVPLGAHLRKFVLPRLNGSS